MSSSVCVSRGEQVRPLGAELPLAALRDRVGLGPLAYGPASDPEEAGELGVTFEAQGGLDGLLGHIHAGQSRLLDPPVKPSRQLCRYGSSPMDTMAERLKRALSLRGMSPTDLIDQKVLSKAGVYFILDGTTKAATVRASTISKLCKALGVNAEWLQHGRGPIEGRDDAPDEQDWSEILGYAQAVGLGRGAEAAEYAETHKLKFRADSLQRKRLRPASLAVMYGSGDSMEPRIKTGDAVLFDTEDREPRDGSVYVVQWKNEVYAKRAMVLDDAVYFAADNPAGDHHWRKPKRMDAKRDPVQVLGRVRWIGSWED